MGNNKETIQKIRRESEQILDKIENDSFKVEYPIKDLRFTGKEMTIKGTPLSKSASNKICNMLRIKSSFGKYYDKMSETEWNKISEKLKDLNGDTTIIAQYKEGGSVISNIFSKNTKKKHDDGQGLRSYFDTICTSLDKSDIGYEFSGLDFDERSHTFDLSMLNRDAKIDIFGDGGDIWNGGNSFTFTPISFSTKPFFERLICTNGMRSRKHGFGTNVSQAKYNVNSISNAINKAITEGTANLNDIITASGQHLANNNVSLGEFYNFRNHFLRDEDNPNFLKIATNYFNDSPIYKAYGMNLAEKSRKWKSTANTGINAYDFFNLLTWIASHQKQTGITDEEARVLQIKASEFFFKENLDLEDIATPVTVNYPRIHEMA